jgi:hypothetical protein
MMMMMMFHQHKSDLSLRDEKSKIYTFIVNTISILMVGRTIAGINYDSEKQLKF